MLVCSGCVNMYNEPRAGRNSRHFKHAVQFSSPLTLTALLWPSQECKGLNRGDQNIRVELFVYCVSQFAKSVFS